ncbi:GD protease, partial [Acromyrmex insinuator]
MAKMYILIALLSQLLFTLVQGQQSPCPQYFRYIIKPGTDETIGQIEIQSPPKVSELHLKVSLKLTAELPTKNYGQLKLAQSTEDSAQAVLQGRSLLYHIYFPLRQPLPTLTSIWFNGKKYCTGSDTTGGVTTTITTITLEHTLYLPNMPSPNSEPNESHRNSTPKPERQQSIPRKATVTFPQDNGNILLNMLPNQPGQVSQYNNNNVFLRKPTSAQAVSQYDFNKNIFLKPSLNKIPHNNNNVFLNQSSKLQPNQSPKPQSNHSRSANTNLLIANGQETLPGEWPWLVALFIVTNRYEFQCAGTILTNKHVLTAGHCLKTNFESNETILPNVLTVALGRFNLFGFREVGTINREVASYTIHPDYTHKTTGDSDLAILNLRKPVEYNHFIKPICLWSGSSDLHDIVSRRGYVVGWGKDEFGHRYTDHPRMAIMPIVSLETCHWSYPGFVKLTSNRTFCAGMQDSGPCNGDSGSALVLFDNTTNRYLLRGVVSRTVFNHERVCDLTKYTVFVDVAKYLVWIQQQISTT